MKIVVIISLLLTLLFVKSNLHSNWIKPWFCHEYDCRPYTVIKKTETFEERCYPAALWVMSHTRYLYGKPARK